MEICKEEKCHLQGRGGEGTTVDGEKRGEKALKKTCPLETQITKN